jgi:hypothetical protein
MHLFMSPHVDIISRGSLTQGNYCDSLVCDCDVTNC